MNILDWFLPKETKNLIKINELWKKINEILQKWWIKWIQDKINIIKIKGKFELIKTKKYKETKDFYIDLIKLLTK